MDQERSKEELMEICNKMTQVSDNFYYGAIHTGCHPFIEFCGLMNKYIDICRESAKQGIDFTMANAHTGESLKLADHHKAYLFEKLSCIFETSIPEVGEVYRRINGQT